MVLKSWQELYLFTRDQLKEAKRHNKNMYEQWLEMLHENALLKTQLEGRETVTMADHKQIQKDLSRLRKEIVDMKEEINGRRNSS